MKQRIGLIGNNSIEFINILLDIWNQGNCAVIIDFRIPFLKAFELLKIANVTKCYIQLGYPHESDKTLDIIEYLYFLIIYGGLHSSLYSRVYLILYLIGTMRLSCITGIEEQSMK